MFYYNENNEWKQFQGKPVSVKQVKESMKIDSIKNVEKLAECFSFGFDVYGFIDPIIETQRGEKVLVFNTNKQKAEEELERMKANI